MSDGVNAGRQPVLYIPHGGGPLPLLGDPAHAGLTTFLREVTAGLPRPSAILLVSAHWEAAVPTVTTARNPTLIYDYYGFPPESYHIQYPAAGSPELAQQVVALLQGAGMQAATDPVRGFDHGVFVPLKLMYPQADIPCVQLSLVRGLNPQAHLAIGRALAPLRRAGVLIVGSGLSFHNLRVFFSHSDPLYSAQFDAWLAQTCAESELDVDERVQRLLDWESAPHARYCHPREEHLLPLHVCFGAAESESPVAQRVFAEELMGQRVSGFKWG